MPQMHPDDTLTRPLHPKLPILLESYTRNPRSKLGANQTHTEPRRPRHHRRSKHPSPQKKPNGLRRQPQRPRKTLQRSPGPNTRSHQPRRRTNTIPQTRRTSRSILQPRIQNSIHSIQRNPTRNPSKPNHRTKPTLHQRMRPRQRDIPKNLQTTHTKRMGKTTRNPRTTKQLQMPNSTQTHTHTKTQHAQAELSNATYLEPKAAMSVGNARQRFTYKDMAWHTEIREFAQALAEASSYNIIDEQEQSQIVLLSQRLTPIKLC